MSRKSSRKIKRKTSEFIAWKDLDLNSLLGEYTDDTDKENNSHNLLSAFEIESDAESSSSCSEKSDIETVEATHIINPSKKQCSIPVSSASG